MLLHSQASLLLSRWIGNLLLWGILSRLKKKKEIAFFKDHIWLLNFIWLKKSLKQPLWVFLITMLHFSYILG